ncbi:MAG: arylesterase, partial [Candidatus Sumerlaeota bacterium]|nr:arylesterase [Candidatus Sumerlaeota bacterium]
MHLKRKYLVLLLLIVAGAFGYYWWSNEYYANYPIVNEKPQGSAIIAFGDSLTYGWGVDKGRDYPTLLSKQLGVEIINKGKPGDTTEDALARIESDVLNL